MRISQHVQMLTVAGEHGTVYPTLIEGESKRVLVDACFPLQMPLLTQALAIEGVAPGEITDLILTHQDLDHIGCVQELKAISPEMKIYAHVIEAPYIDGRETPIKLAALEKNWASLTPEMQDWCKQLQIGFANRRIAMDGQVSAGDQLPGCGIWVLHTPGHTPGHICLYIPADRVLIVGDALNVEDGKLRGPNPQHTFDMDLARSSLLQLLELDIEQVVAYHGGVCSGDVRQQLKQIIG